MKNENVMHIQYTLFLVLVVMAEGQSDLQGVIQERWEYWDPPRNHVQFVFP